MVKFFRNRGLVAVLAGALLALAFPRFNIAGFAWIAPGLMLLAAIGATGRQSFGAGYFAGFAFYLVSLGWLLRIPVAWFPILGWAALAAFLALYPAMWVWLCWRIFPKRITVPEKPLEVFAWGEQFAGISWFQRARWAIAAAAIWVALEMTVARFLGGFPWNLLGDSQGKLLPLIQIASFTGVYGVSFLVVWSSVSMLLALFVILRRPAMRSVWFGEIILPMGAVIAVFGYGYHVLLEPSPSPPELKVALIQPSIPQTMIWDQGAELQRFQDLIRLTTGALTNKPDLVIWPEAAIPGYLRADEDMRKPIFDLARSNHVWMIIGGDDFSPHPGAKVIADSDFYNSSFLISPDGVAVAEYKKRNLVIFGEYVPLIHWLPFIKYLTPIEGGFTPGEKLSPFEMTGLRVNVSTLICFEDVFPHLAREYVSGNTDFLVNLTNDGWFGEGAAQWQQADAALFRAVENGVPLVRCSNNGLTCWIDSRGRIKDYFQTPERGIYGPGFLIAHIPVRTPEEKLQSTFYNRHGDVFGWACFAYAALLLARSFVTAPWEGEKEGAGLR